MSDLKNMLKIADIHANRIEMSTDSLSEIFPFNENTIKNFNVQHILLTELLTARFAKLQDYLGNNIIDAFLELMQEQTSGLTIIDKINKLEKLEIIENAYIWKEMREARNHISHEYPNHPELTATYLNHIYELAPRLIAILNSIKSRVNKMEDLNP